MADVEQPVVPAAEDIKAKSEPKTEEKENTLTNGNHQESPPKNLDEKIIRQIEVSTYLVTFVFCLPNIFSLIIPEAPPVMNSPKIYKLVGKGSPTFYYFPLV